MKFYLGAYYLMKLRDSSNLDSLRKYLYTPSTCINDSLLDGWSLPWVKTEPREFQEAFENFSISLEQIKEIQSWTDEKFNEEKVLWLNVFSDLETLKKYREFFKDNDNLKVLAIYFNETEKKDLLKEFDFEDKTTGSFGIETMLSRQIEENKSGVTIGYDLIGIELSGDFHTFYCHNLADELVEKFSIKINKYGLIEDCESWKSLVEFMNNEENYYEPVPWFLVKVKMFDI